MPLPSLGVILPDDGTDSEWRRIDAWLAARTSPPVRALVAPSVSDGRHEIDSLCATGADETLAGPARRLAQAGCGAIVWACTSGSFVGGLGWARHQAEQLAQTAGRPVTSTSLALLAACGHLGATTVDLLSPYPDPVSERLRAFLADGSVTVADAASLGCPDGQSSHRLDLRAAAAQMATHTSRPLIIPDTAIDSLDLVEGLEAMLARPVITANQATLWQGLKLLDHTAPITGAGMLLARP